MRLPAAALAALALLACKGQGYGSVGVADGALPPDMQPPAALVENRPPQSLGRDGFRVTLQPTFGEYAFAVTMKALPDGCLSRAELLRRTGGRFDQKLESWACGSARVRLVRVAREALVGRPMPKDDQFATFLIPSQEFDRLLERADASLDDWNGRNWGGTDGTVVTIERMRAGRLRSMASNGLWEPDNPVSLVADAVLRLMLAYAPAGTVPRSGDWDVPPSSDEACQRPGLATPLSHGYGRDEASCVAARQKLGP